MSSIFRLRSYYSWAQGLSAGAGAGQSFIRAGYIWIGLVVGIIVTGLESANAYSFQGDVIDKVMKHSKSNTADTDDSEGTKAYVPQYVSSRQRLSRKSSKPVPLQSVYVDHPSYGTTTPSQNVPIDGNRNTQPDAHIKTPLVANLAASEDASGEKKLGEDETDHLKPDEQKPPEVDSKPQALEKKYCKPHISSITAQTVYLLFDTAKNFSNHYFILTTIMNQVGGEQNAYFWVGLSFEVLFNEFFTATNETLAACELIAQYFEGPDSKAFYQPYLKCLNNDSVRTLFMLLGSIDHAIVEDTLPILAMLPLKYLWEDKNGQIIAILSGLILGVSSVLLCMQTYLFEGQSTKKNVELSAQNQSTEPDIIDISLWLAKLLKATLFIMGPFHGAAAGANVFITLVETITSAPEITYPIAGIVAAIACVAIGCGIHNSEVHEAREILENTITDKRGYIPFR